MNHCSRRAVHSYAGAQPGPAKGGYLRRGRPNLRPPTPQLTTSPPVTEAPRTAEKVQHEQRQHLTADLQTQAQPNKRQDEQAAGQGPGGLADEVAAQLSPGDSQVSSREAAAAPAFSATTSGSQRKHRPHAQPAKLQTASEPLQQQQQQQQGQVLVQEQQHQQQQWHGEQPQVQSQQQAQEAQPQQQARLRQRRTGQRQPEQGSGRMAGLEQQQEQEVAAQQQPSPQGRDVGLLAASYADVASVQDATPNSLTDLPGNRSNTALEATPEACPVAPVPKAETGMPSSPRAQPRFQSSAGSRQHDIGDDGVGSSSSSSSAASRQHDSSRSDGGDDGALLKAAYAQVGGHSLGTAIVDDALLKSANPQDVSHSSGPAVDKGVVVRAAIPQVVRHDSEPALDDGQVFGFDFAFVPPSVVPAVHSLRHRAALGTGQGTAVRAARQPPRGAAAGPKGRRRGSAGGGERNSSVSAGDGDVKSDRREGSSAIHMTEAGATGSSSRITAAGGSGSSSSGSSSSSGMYDRSASRRDAPSGPSTTAQQEAAAFQRSRATPQWSSRLPAAMPSIAQAGWSPGTSGVLRTRRADAATFPSPERQSSVGSSAFPPSLEALSEQPPAGAQVAANPSRSSRDPPTSRSLPASRPSSASSAQPSAPAPALPPSGPAPVLGDDSTTVFVKGLDSSLGEHVLRRGLQEAFGRHGRVLQVRIPTERNKRPKGIALVVMEDSAAKARTAALDNTLVLGRFIRLDLKPGPSRQEPTQPEQGPAVNAGKTQAHLVRGR